MTKAFTAVNGIGLKKPGAVHRKGDLFEYLQRAEKLDTMSSTGEYGKMLETTYRFEDTRAYEDS